MREWIWGAAAWLRPTLLVKWALFVLLAVIFTLAINRGKLVEFFDAREKLAAQRAQTAHLQAELQNNKEGIEHVERGDFDVERAARERFNLIRPGEKVLIVETPASGVETPHAPETAGAPKEADSPPSLPPAGDEN